MCGFMVIGRGCVTKIITNLAAIEVKGGVFHLLERAPGVNVEEIITATAGQLIIPDNVPEMNID